MPGSQPIEVIHSKDDRIPSDLLRPSYGDPRFRDAAQTVFLAAGVELDPVRPGDHVGHDDEVEDAFYIDSNTLEKATGPDIDTHRQQAEEEVSTAESPRFFERLIQLCTNDEEDLELVHLVVGVNPHTGNSYHYYGLRGPTAEAVMIETYHLAELNDSI